MTTMEKLFAALLTVSLLTPAPVVFAQEVPDTPVEPVQENVSAPVDATAPQEDAQVASDTPILDVAVVQEPILVEVTSEPVTIQATSTELQETANTQPAVTSEVLEGTVNPEVTTTDDTQSTPVPEAATTTPETPVDPEPIDEVPLEDVAVALDIVAEDLTPEPDVSPTPDSEVAAIALPQEDLTPDPQFAFALTGKSIPSKKVLKDRDGRKVGEQSVSHVAETQVDNAKGVITVSGKCSDVYFVILLYRNQNDYVDDPSSYLVNRAYPCVNGTYSYSIEELPHNLEHGQYYLLVGQEGNTGTWTPITGLTEITINRN